MPIVEIDQSGRMEMSGDTTVAASDGFTRTIKLTAKVKIELRQILRDRGVKRNLISIRMFVSAIVLAIRGHVTDVSGVMIDEEYSGYEVVIRSLLTEEQRTVWALDAVVALSSTIGKAELDSARKWGIVQGLLQH